MFSDGPLYFSYLPRWRLYRRQYGIGVIPSSSRRRRYGVYNKYLD